MKSIRTNKLPTGWQSGISEDRHTIVLDGLYDSEAEARQDAAYVIAPFGQPYC